MKHTAPQPVIQMVYSPADGGYKRVEADGLGPLGDASQLVSINTFYVTADQTIDLSTSNKNVPVVISPMYGAADPSTPGTLHPGQVIPAIYDQIIDATQNYNALITASVNYVYDNVADSLEVQKMGDISDFLTGALQTYPRTPTTSITQPTLYDPVNDGFVVRFRGLDNSDAQAEGGEGISSTINRPQVFNGTTYDRVRGYPANANGLTAPTLGLMGTAAFMFGVNASTGNFDRLALEGTDTDAAGGHIARNSGATIAASHMFAFNDEDTGFDRVRNNRAITMLASAARTTLTSSADFVNYNGRGAHFTVNVAAYTAGGLTVTIEGKDPVSGSYYTILSSAVIAATGLNILKVYPGAVAVPNASASDVLPRDFRVTVTPSDATSITYSVGCNLVN